ncbi:MAG: hypothetical protein RLY20_3467 [Verrucomicrobiota bacterium]|jgi:peptidyl-prolyl cis-trans isomerase C
MKSIIKTTVAVASVLALTSAASIAADSTNTAAEAKPAPKLSELFPDEVIAQGKGVKVMRSAVDEEMANIKASAAARGQPIPPQRLQMIEAQVLDNIIGRQLLAKRATDADKSAGTESAGKKLEAITKNTGGEEALARQLKVAGMTLEQLKAKLAEEETAEAVLNRELKFEVSDADVKTFYDENPNQFEQPELVRAAHVLIGTKDKDGGEMSDAKKKEQRKLAEDILKRAKAGEDFAKLAKEYSDDPGSKDKGGEYTFPRGQMVPDFEAAAFSQDAGQISDIVPTQFGFHIIKTIEKKPAKKITLEEVAGDIKRALRRQGIMKQVPDFMERVAKEAGVEILDKDLKKLIEAQRAAEQDAIKRAEARAAEEAKPATKK